MWPMMELNGANKARYLYRPEHLTWFISSGELIFHDLLLRWAVIAFMALFIPFRKSITLTPAATALHPSVRIACVSTVAQVVPVSRSDQKQSEWNYTPLRKVICFRSTSCLMYCNVNNRKFWYGLQKLCSTKRVLSKTMSETNCYFQHLNYLSIPSKV